MERSLSYLLICLTVVLSQFAAAETYGGGGGAAGAGGNYYIEGTFFPVYVKKNDAENYAGGSVSKNIPTESGLGYDFRTTVGYVWENILFGLTYNMYKVNTSRPQATPDYGSLKTSTAKTDIGPTIGYLLNSWRFAFTYIASSTKTYSEQYGDSLTGAITTDNTYKNTQGSGFQLAISYELMIGSSGVSIGPTLIYRDVTYKQQSLNGISSSYASTSAVSKPVDAELKPMISLGYRF